MTFQLAARGGTPTMRGEYCLAQGPAGLTCSYGDGHTADHHLTPEGVRWQGGPARAEVPVYLTVGHLDPAKVGTITVDTGSSQKATASVADLLDAVAEEMRATLARWDRERTESSR
jgi:hypothetical protein